MASSILKIEARSLFIEGVGIFQNAADRYNTVKTNDTDSVEHLNG